MSTHFYMNPSPSLHILHARSIFHTFKLFTLTYQSSMNCHARPV